MKTILKNLTKHWLITGIITIICIIGIYYFFSYKKGNENLAFYKTEPLQYGTIVSTISATGTVEPEELIDVGAQVAGRIVSFGKDENGKTIDWGSNVTKDTILAKIDDSLYYADMLQAKAQLEDNQASLQKAEADLLQYKAKLFLAYRDFIRAEKLRAVESVADYDTYKSAYNVAMANIKVCEAVITSAKAKIDLAKSALQRAQQNLDYCTIRSPVNGIVIDRRVNIGQTVVASLNAPSLFLIAKDLKRMEVWVSVNEADIGKIDPGQNVTFTVDTFPGITFKGKVSKVRLNASVTQNVVTYIVVVTTDNSNGKLLPYLTAKVCFETAKKDNVFMVNNTALRWSPSKEVLKEKITSNIIKTKESQGTESNSVIWILTKDTISPIEVHIGISNDTMTEISSPELKKGMQVVTGTLSQTENKSTTNPFLPQFKRKR